MTAATSSALRGLAAGARGAVLAPFWAAQLLTGAKSFMDNPLIGSAALNRRGLHTGRVRLADRLAAARRARLARLVSPADRAAFDRDGFVVREGFLPPELFAALRAQAEAYRGPARETVQGNAVTRRFALDPATLDRIPAARAVLADPTWRGLVRYAGSADAEPVTYVQTILSHAKDGPDDPQCVLHADTFHATVKAWLFLTDVAEDEGPFSYVPGSHRLTPARLEWERQRSLELGEGGDRLSRRGSLRIRADELPQLGLPPARLFAVPANTLVVADTHGFHARGPSVRPTRRVELWAYGRRNPFLPWAGPPAGLDPWRIEALGARRVGLFWRVGDILEGLCIKGQTWQPTRGDASPFDRN